MWLKLGEEEYVPVDELVGIFRPGSLEVPGREGIADKKVRSIALLADGRAVASPSGLKGLANRLKAGKM